LKIDVVCGQIVAVQHFTHNGEDQSGRVDVMLGFDNPGIPVSLDWTISGQTNATGGVVSGFLSSTIPIGKSILNMSFYLQPWISNGTITQISSFTKYSALLNTVSDPRIFSQSFSASEQILGFRKVNETAIYFPIVLAYLFYTQTGFYPRTVGSSLASNPTCRGLFSEYGFPM
jgi:hypothetical protein